MLTIGYDGTALLRQRAGIGRYARELLTALDKLDGGDDHFKVIASAAGGSEPRPALGPRVRWFDLPVSDRVSNAVWHRMRLPFPVEARTGRLDVFHSPDFSLAPSLAPAVVTIHDLAFEVMPQVSYPTLAGYLHTVTPRSIKHAKAVIAPSEYTKQSITRCYVTDPDKIHVIPEGVSPRFSSEAQPDDEAQIRAHGLTGPYLFTAGTLEPRKNTERLLDAFAIVRQRHPELVLALAGQRGWMDDGIFRKREELELGESARFLGHVGDDALPALYRRATATVYPSLLEGFGLPALEALACGSPLVTSGNSSMPEACGDAAIYIDPWDIEDMASTIDTLLEDEQTRRSLHDRGPARASEFTWERTAGATMRLYHDVAQA